MARGITTFVFRTKRRARARHIARMAPARFTAAMTSSCAPASCAPSAHDRLLEATAPRYTSYPPAPHFHPGVDATTARSWLGALPEETELSLYLHIPYCRSICWYCGCHTVAAKRDAPVIAYAQTLAKEIALVAQAAPARAVRQIHWGGGTPNALPPEAFLSLVEAMNEGFDLSGLQEHAIEIDPRTLTPRHAEALAIAGVTRASFGVQDLNLHVQEAIGRVQPLEQVAQAFAMLREAGVPRFNADVMYGLPKQSIADAVRTAELAASLGPDRLAAFGYAHVPWFKTRQRLIDTDSLPGPRERLAQAQAIRDTLLRLGYKEIGFDHYAKPEDPLAVAAREGGLKRNFQGYVDDAASALIGLGASAISGLPQGYLQNAADIPAWSRAIESGALATARGFALSDEDRRRRALIERLLCDFELDIAAFGGWTAFADSHAPLAALAADGVVRLDGDRLTVTEDGKPFVRLVAQAFDAYRDTGSGRHSKAV